MARGDASGNYQPEELSGPQSLESLGAYVQRELTKLSQSMNLGFANHSEKTSVVPGKPRDGNLRYADGTNWNPGNGAGMYSYHDGGWHFMEDLFSTSSKVGVLTRSSNTALAVGNHAAAVRATAAFTQTFNAASGLGNGWWVAYLNDSTGDIVFDPNGSETIDGATTLTLQAGDSCFIYCDGSNFYTIARSQGIPVGTMLDMATGFVDPGFLACDGSAVTGSTYPRLYAKMVVKQTGTTSTSVNVTALQDTTKIQIGMFVVGSGVQAGTIVNALPTGTTATLSLPTLTSVSNTPLEFSWWGSALGTTFTLPDTRRRVSMGVGGTAVSGPGNKVGNVGGAETHTLLAAESGLPSHTHTVPEQGPAGGAFTFLTNGANNPTTTSAHVGAASANASQAHNNVQPTYVVLKQIKY